MPSPSARASLPSPSAPPLPASSSKEGGGEAGRLMLGDFFSLQADGSARAGTPQQGVSKGGAAPARGPSTPSPGGKQAAPVAWSVAASAGVSGVSPPSAGSLASSVSSSRPPHAASFKRIQEEQGFMTSLNFVARQATSDSLMGSSPPSGSSPGCNK